MTISGATRVDERCRSAPSPAARRARWRRRPMSRSSPGRARNASVSASRMRRISSRSSSSSSTMSLLISTVADGSRKSDGAACRAAVHDAGHVAAMLGADHQHVAAIALGDHLLLEVFRRVLATHELLERGAQPVAFLAQPIADASQLGARVVEHLPRCIDRAPHGCDLLLEAGDARRRYRSGSETTPPAFALRFALVRPNRRSPRRCEVAAGRADGPGRRARPAFRAARSTARRGNRAVRLEIVGRLGRRRRVPARRPWDRSGSSSRGLGRAASRQAGTASTMRSNSRVRRASMVERGLAACCDRPVQAELRLGASPPLKTRRVEIYK